MHSVFHENWSHIYLFHYDWCIYAHEQTGTALEAMWEVMLGTAAHSKGASHLLIAVGAHG